ncbi:hypothetical protein EST38_g3841 [Candolleomyces aberdarensis]|uniref:Uncharacterized protein n=1 Tax=Candolleomyces aberdarensis TaxID=2316362 RepID=A0A4Q2DR33_9AGAR|nr:hypothetical protein EST38_g3841 [Candolleomyces aberdarensis]
MRFSFAHRLLLTALLATTCLFVAGSPSQAVFSVSKAGIEAVSVWWSWFMSFEACWGIISSAQEKGKAMADSALKEIAEEYKDVADKVQLFQEEFNKIVEHATELREQLSESNIDLAVVHDYMTQEAAKVAENLQKEFNKPLPDEMDERARYRNEMISKGLEGLETAFVDVCVKSGRMSEEDARRIFEPIKKAIQDGLLVAGNIVDKHPKLVQTIIITAVCLMIPESFILRPILSLFGFGPTGPIKGSLAAWMQRRFWGGAVARGSWFAFFQRAGMFKGFWGKAKVILAAILALIENVRASSSA